MTQAAISKHPCPECGGEAVWNPTQAAFACPYCGTVLANSAALLEAKSAQLPDAYREHDLHEALRRVGIDQRGYAPGLATEVAQQVQCQSCKAISIFTGAVVGRSCDFCGSPSLLPHHSGGDAIRPQAILPFAIDNGRAREAIKHWLSTRWFAPNKLKAAALIDQMHGIYLPYWTFDADASGNYQAQAGEYYYVTSGKNERERRTRWHSVSGFVQAHFDDELICGSVGLDLALLHQIEPFDTKQGLQPYSSEYLRGWTVERYQLDLRKASDMNANQMYESLKDMAGAEVLRSADEVADIQLSADYQQRKFKHVLLPVWLVHYTYGHKRKHVLVNGANGKVAGEYPLSIWKIIFYGVIPALVVVYLILQNQGR